jgi:hypothetical protein
MANNNGFQPRFFRKAARLISKEKYACHALERVTQDLDYGMSYEYQDKLEKIYKPEKLDYFEAWFTESKDPDTSTDSPTGLLRRELALLFLAEVVKQENKEKAQ